MLTNPPRPLQNCYATQRYQLIAGRRYARQASFIRYMYSEGFSIDEIKKVFRKMSKTEIYVIVKS